MKKKCLNIRNCHLLIILLFCSLSMIIGCGNPVSEGEKAEQFVEEFFTYYLENYDNITDEIKSKVATNYLTNEYGEEYLYYMNNNIDLLAGGTIYREGEGYFGKYNSAIYQGGNKVKVIFDSNSGGQFYRLITLRKVESDFLIDKVEVVND